MWLKICKPKLELIYLQNDDNHHHNLNIGYLLNQKLILLGQFMNDIINLALSTVFVFVANDEKQRLKADLDKTCRYGAFYNFV